MNRPIVCAAGLVVAALAAAVLFTGGPAEGKKTYGDGDLDGTYAWVTSETRREGGVMEYCSGYGEIEFFGDGTAWSTGTHRCDAAGSFTTAELHGYAVDPDGGFLLWEDDDPVYQTHCRLVDRGAMILCDGTASHPEVLAMTAVAVKQ